MTLTTIARECILVAAALGALTSTVAAQPAYPSKPIRMIVPYATGGSVTILARYVSQKLNEAWGQQVIVDNRPGGNTVIGSEALAKSAPDGYTIMLTSMDLVTVPHLLNTPFDAIRDFVPVATIGVSEFVMVLNPAVPAGSLPEFIDLAKSRPGRLNFASAGGGSPAHIAAESFNIAAGVKMQHVPYKGGAPAITDLIGGQVDLYFSPIITVLPHIKAGRLKPIATSGNARSAALPQVATFSEGGLPGLDIRLWFALFAPAGTPREITDRISAEVDKMLKTPDFREKLVSQGMEPFITTNEQFSALMRNELAKFGRVIKAANIRLDN